MFFFVPMKFSLVHCQKWILEFRLIQTNLHFIFCLAGNFSSLMQPRFQNSFVSCPFCASVILIEWTSLIHSTLFLSFLFILFLFGNSLRSFAFLIMYHVFPWNQFSFHVLFNYKYNFLSFSVTVFQERAHADSLRDRHLFSYFPTRGVRSAEFLRYIFTVIFLMGK